MSARQRYRRGENPGGLEAERPMALSHGGSRQTANMVTRETARALCGSHHSVEVTVILTKSEAQDLLAHIPISCMGHSSNKWPTEVPPGATRDLEGCALSQSAL